MAAGTQRARLHRCTIAGPCADLNTSGLSGHHFLLDQQKPEGKTHAREHDKKAFFINRYRKNIGAGIGERLDPEIESSDVVVQVLAAGLNPLKSKIRDGEFKVILPQRLPIVPGNETAGVVVRVGSKVTQFRPATRSMGGRTRITSALLRN
jgi:hypothetical protein